MIPGTQMSTSSASATLGYARALSIRRTIRAWLCVALLAVTPIAVYWPTVFHEYGFRDDYAHLRESRESPEKLVDFTSSYGRPIYGSVLVASVAPMQGEVADLSWLRLASVAILTLVGMLVMRLLLRAGWSTLESAAIGLTLTLLPAAQVTVGWAIAMPVALALLLSVLGYTAVGAALERRGLGRAALWVGGGGAYVLAGFTYQPSALFAVVPLAAALLLRNDDARSRVGWTVAHLGTVFGALAVCYALLKVLLALESIAPAGVVAFEANPLAKLLWFLYMPIANALALFVLRDRFDTPPVFWVAAAGVLWLIVKGFRERENRAPIDRWTVAICVTLLPLAAYAVNLVAAVRVAGYRTTYGLAGLVVVFVVYALHTLHARGRIGRKTHYAALALFVLSGAVLASRHSYQLIAQPQGLEWSIVRDAARRIRFDALTRIYLIRPAIEDRATIRTYADEFGSLSSNSEWATAEMFKSALRLRFPTGLPAGRSYSLASGLDVPRTGAFDVVIDMRALKQHRRK